MDRYIGLDVPCVKLHTSGSRAERKRTGHTRGGDECGSPDRGATWDPEEAPPVYGGGNAVGLAARGPGAACRRADRDGYRQEESRPEERGHRREALVGTRSGLRSSSGSARSRRGSTKGEDSSGGWAIWRGPTASWWATLYG